MKEKKPKQLWFASLTHRPGGKWLPTQTFYLDKAYFPNVVKPVKCHVLYETPMEALISLHKEIMEKNRRSKNLGISVFIYAVKIELITAVNYFSPDKIAEKEIFTFDRDLLKRHLIRQSLLFTKVANLEIEYSCFTKEPLLDLFFTDSYGVEKYLLTLREPKVTYTSGEFARFQNKAIENAFFKLNEYAFSTPIILKPHQEKKDVGKRDLASGNGQSAT